MKPHKSERLYSIFILIVGLALLGYLATGCATQGKSVALGGAMGAGAGAIAGGIADPGKDGEYRTRNVIIGSAIGGVAGVAAGALLHNNSEDKKREAYSQGQSEEKAKHAKSGVAPTLTNPQVEARWVEGKVIGNRFIDGHFEYVITEPARWEGN